MVKFFKNVKRLRMKITSIILIVVLLTLEFSPLAVKAAKQQRQFGYKRVYQFANDTYNGRGLYFSDAKLDGNTAYCIDYGYYLPSGLMTYSRNASDQVLAVLINGYPNSTPEQLGCQSEDEAYLATQMALWEVVQRVGDSKKVKLYFRVENIVATPNFSTTVPRAIEAAAKLVTIAETNPYSHSPELHLKGASAQANEMGDYVVFGPYSAEVKGIARPDLINSITASLVGAPESAVISDAQGNPRSTTVQNGEEIYVRMDVSEPTVSFKIRFHADVDRLIGAIYTDNGSGSQDYIMIDREPTPKEGDIPLTWNNDATRGSISLTKVDDEDQPIAGVKFRVEKEDGTYVGEAYTDYNGKIEMLNLEVGNYVLIEEEAPAGYVIKNESTNVTVVGRKTVDVKVVNDRVKGNLVIVKTDENMQPIEGVTFNILNSKYQVVNTVTTDEDGFIGLVNLPAGKYYCQEVSAPAQYEVDDTIYEFGEITTNDQILRIDLINYLKEGRIKIVKVDEEDKPIANVTFEILDANKSVVDTITTDENGIARSKQLQPGTYYYKETSAPDKYIVDSTEYQFEIENNGEIVEKEVVNYLAKGSIELHKYNNKEEVLANVKFNILDSSKNVVDTIVTNENGVATSKDLPLGTYYYVEVEAPDNVIMDTEEHEFALTRNEQVYRKTVINEIKEGNGKLEIHKYDSKQNSLANVKFNILDAEKNVVDTIVTDENGIAQSKDLPVGTYYYVEVEAPDNVIMDTKEHEFVLSKNNEVVTKTVVNELKEGTLKIIKVDENNEPLAGVTFEILDANKKVVDTIVTDENGIAQSKELEKGTYYYRETKAPEGIVVDSTEYEFAIVEDGQNVIKNVVNYYAKGQLKILKLVEGKNTPLAGVKFDLLDEDRNVIDTLVTDENGYAESKKIPMGTYYFKEVEAPDGYIMDESEHSFEILADGDLIEAVVYNKEEELPKTGGLLGDNMIIILAVSLISIFGYALINLVSVRKED